MQTQIGCFNQSGYPGCRQVEETVVMHIFIRQPERKLPSHLQPHLVDKVTTDRAPFEGACNTNHYLADIITTEHL